MCICQYCNREYEYDRSKGHTKRTCNSCHANRRRFKLNEQIRELRGESCQICGYSRCWKSMQFHHVDPSKKVFQISGAHSRSWNSIKRELNKCLLVCANCHGEIEDGMISVEKQQTMLSEYQIPV